MSKTVPAPGRVLLDALPDPTLLYELSAEGSWRVTAVNAAFAPATGYEPHEVIGREPGVLFGPLTTPDVRAGVRAGSDAGGFSQPVVFHHRDGSPLFCQLKGGRLPSEPGEPEQAWCQIVLERGGDNQRFQRLLANVTDIVAVLDADAVIRYISPSVTRFGDLSPATVIGLPIFDRLDPAWDAEHRAFWAEVVATPGMHGPAPVTLYDTSGVGHPVEIVLNNRLDDPELHGIVVTARDATDRLAADQLAARHERRLRALVQHASDIVLVLDRGGAVQYASPSVMRYLGGAVQDDRDQLLAFVHPDDVARVVGVIGSRVEHEGDTAVMEVRLGGKDGSWCWFEVAATSLLADPDVSGIVINGRDISERRRTEALLAGELAALEAMVDNQTPAPVLLRLAEVAEAFLPGAACTIGVRDDDGVVRHPAAPSLPAEIVLGLDGVAPSSTLGATVRGGDGPAVCSDVTADPGWDELSPLLEAAGLRSCWWVPVRSADSAELLGVVTVFHREPRGPDPTEQPVLDRIAHLAALALQRARFERRLEHQSLHDALTGLPNRNLVIDRVGQALEVARRRSTQTAVIFIDIDRFKLVNDNLGQTAGDELLARVAERLAGAARVGDTVGRFGGDEFIVVIEDVLGETDAVAAGDRMRAALEVPVEVVGERVRVTASIGVAVTGPDPDDLGPDALVRNADAAMHRAKDAGGARVCLFEEILHDEVVRRYDLEQGLRAALDDGELAVLYQPRVRLADGRVTGVEALLRWDRPGRGRIGADELVPVAEETGLIVPIGAWVLGAACEQAIAWDADPATFGLEISVNLSARQLGDPDLVATVAGTLAHTRVAPGRLCLEVTESALAKDTDQAVAALTALAGLGVRLAIDDFGTGYATLDYVRRFSMAHELKIDRSFVAGVADLHSADAAIVSAAIVLADALGFDVVAEGVETAEQLTTLRRLGCGSAQGYYFGVPMDPGSISR
jgi:diguanylate cyclase (GGDEF)-like protein/PAS domain S-box-containing protein